MVETEHIPVLVDKVVELLVTRVDGFYVDATVGTGGHARAILEQGSPGMELLGIDFDEKAIEIARKKLSSFGPRVKLVCGDYTDIENFLSGRKCDGVFMDLGLSSLQLADSTRGFSYMFNSRIDMSMGSRAKSVIKLLNRASVEELADILRRYGEEPKAWRIAKKIVRERNKKPIERTFQLREIVNSSVSPRSVIGALSRVFQALRIWANNELENVENFLRKIVDLVNPGGRIAVIGYHSLEDRIVKRIFKEEEKGCICPPDFPECVCGRKRRLKIITKKVIKPSAEEIEQNPRARSARLRVAERLEDEKLDS